MRRAAVLVLLPVVLAGCGGQAALPRDVARAPVAAPADPAALLTGLPAAARDAGSVRYAAVTEGALDGAPATVEARMSGVLDTATDAGTAELELLPLSDLAEMAPEGEDAASVAALSALARTSLSWTATRLTAVVGGERVSGPRADADSGVLARVPSEPAGLFDVVAAATDVTVAGSEEVDGVPTTRLTGSAQPQAAVDAGLGTQAQLSIARLPSLPVEVWVDGEGRPARIRYEVTLPSLQQGRSRTMTTTYDYRGWGEPVDVTP